MTQQEILEAVQKNIAGQGSMVDISGKLPEILAGIAEGAKFAKKTEITVRVYAKKLNEGGDDWESDAGATGVLIVKGFSESGETLPVQEIPFTIPDDAGFATVEFDATIGDTIGIVGKIADKGASCQIVQKVVGPTTVSLEIYPAGIYEIGDGLLAPNPGEDMYRGCAIVTDDFAIALPRYQRDGWIDQYIRWGGIFQPIPFVLKTADSNEAITDFDGALNTAAILSVVKNEDVAPRVASIMPESDYMRFGAFLPSAGMLKYLYEHRTEINAFIEAETEAYGPDVDYQTIPDAIDAWASTDYINEDNAAAYAWYLNFNSGNAVNNVRSTGGIAFAVCNFQTLYD